MTLRGEHIGLMTVDPGRTTGYTTSHLILRGATEDLWNDDNPLFVGHMNCWDQAVPETQCEIRGIMDLADEYENTAIEWARDHKITKQNHYLVIEDFVLRGKLGGTERSGLSPVRVTYGLLAVLEERRIRPNIIFQSAADAKGTATNDRLRRWNLWTPGLEHGRDATRHAVVFARRAIG